MSETFNGRTFDVLLGQGLGPFGEPDPRNWQHSVSAHLLAKGRPTAYDKVQDEHDKVQDVDIAKLMAAVFPPVPPGPVPPSPAPPAPVPPAPVPPVGDSWAYTGPQVLDQGQEGECGGYGSATRALCEPNPIAWSTDLIKETESNLAERIYLQALKNDGWNGQGSPDEQAGASPDAIAKANVDLSIAKAYHWCFSIGDVIAALALGPVDLAIPWTQDMFTPDANGIIHATGPVAGGHWITDHAYDPATDLHELVQTWGTGWGVNGYARISSADLASLLAQQGQAALFTS